MYPQPILFLIAMKVKRNTGIILNSLVLSLIGGLIAGYHYLMQIGIVAEKGCDVVGMTVKCSEYFGLSYGFITIPMMAFVAFVLLVFIAYGKLKACESRDIYNK
jgi:disulfide bond formation protein DsbB